MSDEISETRERAQGDAGRGWRLCVCHRRHRPNLGPRRISAPRRASPARPIADGTTPYAIFPGTAPPSGGSCARSKRWRKRSGAGRDARRATRRRPCCAGSTASRGHFRDQIVHELFGRSRWRRNEPRDRDHRLARSRADAGAPPAWRHRAPGARDRRCGRPSLAPLSRGRHARDHATARLDHRGHAAGRRGFSRPLRARAARPAARARPVASARSASAACGPSGRVRRCASRRRARRCGARSRRSAGSPRRRGRACGMSSAGSARSRNGLCNRAGAGAGSARKPPRAS